MKSLCSCTIGGNLTRDGELRYTKNGIAVGNLGLAINYKMGEDREETAFIEVRLWGKLAEGYKMAFLKGRYVLLTNLRYRVDEYEGENGEIKRKHYFESHFGTEVVLGPEPASRSQSQERREEPEREEEREDNIPF